MISQWGITHKVTGLVTDGAANMGACAKAINLRHSHCVAHCLNLVVKKALGKKKCCVISGHNLEKLVISRAAPLQR